MMHWFWDEWWPGLGQAVRGSCGVAGEVARVKGDEVLSGAGGYC